MTKIDKFTPRNLDQIADAINKALKSVGEEFGIVLETGKMSYGDTTSTIRVECAISNGNAGALELKYKSGFIKLCRLFDMEEKDYGKIVKISGNRNAIIYGIAPSNRKYPIILKIVDGGKFIKSMAEPIAKQLKTPSAAKLGDRANTLTRTPPPEGLIKKAGIRSQLNDNEMTVIKHIRALVNGSKDNCTMTELLEKMKNEAFQNSSIMVYVGNLKKKGYITRDSKKNIFLA